MTQYNSQEHGGTSFSEEANEKATSLIEQLKANLTLWNDQIEYVSNSKGTLNWRILKVGWYY